MALTLELNMWASRYNYNGNLQDRSNGEKRTFSQLVTQEYFLKELRNHFVGNSAQQQTVIDLVQERDRAMWSWFKHSDDFLIWNPDDREVIVVYNSQPYAMTTLVSATAHSRYSEDFSGNKPRRPDIVYRNTF